MARWYLLLFAISTGWGTIPLILREVDVAPSTIAFARVLVAAAGLGAVLLVQRGERTFPRPYSVEPIRCLANGALLAAHWFTMFVAFDRAPAGTVILIIFLAPVGVAAIAPRLLGEHLSTAIVAAVALGLVGVALIAGPALGNADPGGLAMAAASMTLLIALNLASKPLVAVYGGLRLAFMETAGAALFLAPVAVVLHTGSLATGWPWLLLLGLVHTAFGVTMYLSALRHLPVTHASILTYLEPASVVVLAWLVLAETPTLLTSIGGLLVVGAGILVVSAGRGESLPPEPVAQVGAANAPR
ncbi:MAG TPA: DMT family transporter [Acidimicrobiales bacterium]|nr:DMT family transporter [Acidimicrobiales bacterium]